MITDAPRAAQPHIKFDARGAPFIEAHRCRACQATVTGPRLACPACLTRDSFEAIPVGELGRLVAYSIVKRSYPGVPTPFVSAVVEMDDKVTLKANLVGAGFEPEAIKPLMRVCLRFNDALGRRDKDGHAYVGYHFEPEQR